MLLLFQKFCCRSVSVGFARKTAVFGSVSVFFLTRFPPVVNVVRLCGPLHIKPAAVRYIFLCITPVDSSKYQQRETGTWKPPPVPNVTRVAKWYLSGSLRHRHPLLVSICTARRQSSMFTDRRNRLGPKKADMQLFIKHNLPLISFKYWVLSTWNRSLACCAY